MSFSMSAWVSSLEQYQLLSISISTNVYGWYMGRCRKDHVLVCMSYVMHWWDHGIIETIDEVLFLNLSLFKTDKRTKKKILKIRKDIDVEFWGKVTTKALCSHKLRSWIIFTQTSLGWIGEGWQLRLNGMRMSCPVFRQCTKHI